MVSAVCVESDMWENCWTNPLYFLLHCTFSICPGQNLSLSLSISLSLCVIEMLRFTFTFTFSHLADAFVQSDVQGIGMVEMDFWTDSDSESDPGEAWAHMSKLAMSSHPQTSYFKYSQIIITY